MEVGEIELTRIFHWTFQDVEVEVGVPGTAGRRQILELMLARAGHAVPDGALDALASATQGAATACALQQQHVSSYALQRHTCCNSIVVATT